MFEILGVLESVLIFVFVLSFLVIIHELGHYFAARFFGVRIDEFGVGLPPKAKTLFHKWGTEFTLNWLPIGGFVKLAGEERHMEDKKVSKPKPGETDDLFFTKPAWPKVAILAAGAAVNFVFGIIAFSTLFTFIGVPQEVPLEQGVFVTAVSAESPALEAGIEPGDIILSILLSDLEAEPITDSNQFVELVNQNRGQEVILEISRQDEILEKEIYIRTEDEVPAGEGSIGVGIVGSTLEFVRGPWYERPFQGAWYGMVSSVGFGLEILRTLGNIFGDLFTSGQVPSDLAGPVGIAEIVHQENSLNQGVGWIVNLAAVLSINLAILNLLPIPALDGGRIIFVLVEKVMGRNIQPAVEQYSNLVGFVFLISLIVLVTIGDISRIVSRLGMF